VSTKIKRSNHYRFYSTYVTTPNDLMDMLILCKMYALYFFFLGDRHFHCQSVSYLGILDDLAVKIGFGSCVYFGMFSDEIFFLR